MTSDNLHIAWAELLLRHMMQAGVRHAVVSPGSRSTPLVLALAQQREIRTEVVIDERSAAFVALGHARATQKPSILLCTSGSAVAHYFPAIVEASLGHVPMLVVTADRPWDAYDCGAPQTIDQCKMYGDYVRHYAELGLPDSAAFSAVVRVALQSVAATMGPRPGPVHINARFRKPLDPQTVETPEPWRPAWQSAMNSWCTAATDSPQPSSSLVSQWAFRLSQETQGVIALGPSLGASLSSAALFELAARTGYPVLAEAASGLRFAFSEHSPAETSPVVYAIDAILSSQWFAQSQPKIVLEIGLPMVSTAYARWISEKFVGERLVIAAHSHQDPTGRATLHWNTDVNRALQFINHHLAEIEKEEQSTLGEPRRAQLSGWSTVDARAQSAARNEVTQQQTSLTEGTIAAEVRAGLIEHSTLIIGNSAVLRDVDGYAFAGPSPVSTIHQRGASGIDGMISLAVGVRGAQKKRPVVLLTGDIATWHDVGALQLAASVDQPLVIVIVQNHGGRIFDRLPVSKSNDAATRATYERFFVADQGREFGEICKGFSVAYHRCTTPEELRTSLHSSLRTPVVTVIEAICTPGGAERFSAMVRAGAAAVDKAAGLVP